MVFRAEALLEQVSQCRSQRVEARDPLLDVRESISRHGTDLLPGDPGSSTKGKKILDFVKSEAEFLSRLDETGDPHRLPIVDAMSRLGTGWWRQKASPLVIADRLNVDVRRRCHFRDLHAFYNATTRAVYSKTGMGIALGSPGGRASRANCDGVPPSQIVTRCG